VTIFGWDCSHFDGPITAAIAARAAAEGIAFATHKIGEGGSYDDPGDGTALANFRAAGLRVLGGYYVVRSGLSVGAQVDACIALADRDEPWWRDFPGWFWQVDLELWGYDNVPAARGIAFSQQLTAASGKGVVLYASRGMYGGGLTAWAPRPLWNADYGANPTGPFRDIYPGDTSRGWTPYSGMTPALLQYSSRATIAGLTTCDANAYRGTIDQLLTLIGGTPMAGFDATDLHFLLTTKALPNDTPTETVGTALLQAQAHAASADAKLDGLGKKVDTLLAAIQALATGGSNVDTAAVIAAVNAAADRETAVVTQLRAALAAALAAAGDTIRATP